MLARSRACWHGSRAGTTSGVLAKNFASTPDCCRHEFRASMPSGVLARNTVPARRKSRWHEIRVPARRSRAGAKSVLARGSACRREIRAGTLFGALAR